MTQFKIVRHQVGQCRIFVYQARTKDWYASLPLIKENCNCGHCVYFEEEIIKRDIGLFKVLSSMNVDLKRQPKLTADGGDGVMYIGDTARFKHAYMGSYQVFGNIDRTQRKQRMENEDGQVIAVDFYESKADSYTQYTIEQVAENVLIFNFYIECEKKIAFHNDV